MNEPPNTQLSNGTPVFQAADGSQIRIFVEAGGISSRPKLVRTLKKAGAIICNDPKNAQIILVDPDTYQGKRFIRDWGKDADKVVLNFVWAYESIEAGNVYNDEQWGGFLTEDDGLPLEESMDDGKSPLPTPCETPVDSISSRRISGDNSVFRNNSILGRRRSTEQYMTEIPPASVPSPSPNDQPHARALIPQSQNNGLNPFPNSQNTMPQHHMQMPIMQSNMASAFTISRGLTNSLSTSPPPSSKAQGKRRATSPNNSLYSNAHQRPSLPDAWVNPEATEESERLFKKPRRPTLEKSNTFDKWDPSSTKMPDRECSVFHSPPNSIPAIWKPSIPPEVDAAASKPYNPVHRGSTTMMQSIGSATGIRPPATEPNPERSDDDAIHEGGNDREKGQYSIPHRGDKRHASPVLASLKFTPIPHSSSNNGYRESHKDRKRLRPSSSLSPSGSSRYHAPPSLVPRSKLGGYLQNVNPFDNRERPDHVRNSYVKSDRRSNRTRLRAVWDAERVGYDDYFSHVYSNDLSTAKLKSALRPRATPPLVDSGNGLEAEYIGEPGLYGDPLVGHWLVRSPSWPREEDWKSQEEGTLSRFHTARLRSFNEREKRKQLEKEKSRAEAEGADYGTHETNEEDGEERKGQEEEETGKREEDGAKTKQVEDTRQGFQDWDSSDCFGYIYCDGLPVTKPISAALLLHTSLPDGSVPHSESIQERLCRLDEMDLSESRILLLEKIHEEMWEELPTIEFIKWNDLPWPVFVRTTCPVDLMLHRIVSYALQVSSGTDIKVALVDSNRLQWGQQRLRILLSHWGQPGLQKKVENSADKTMIQGVNVVTNHLESLLDFVNMHQIDEAHHTDLATIIPQTFLKHVGGNLARILTDTSDNSGYKSLLKLEGNSTQKMLNFLQTLLDCSELVSLPRNDILGALLRLSKLSKLYPECLTITDLERDDDVLDSGRFGEIYKGRSRNQAICLKVIKVNQKTQIKHLLKAFLKEALLWGHLSHPNILPFYGIYHLDDTHGRISFVSPWMENGNVAEYLKRYPLANRLLLIWDIILGIQFLHQNKVIHGDLKGLNVLVNRSGRGCLADFGLANLVDEDILRWTSIQSPGHQGSGTLRWQAPELIDPPSDESAKATPASDIYSFACVCFEIYTGHVPFHTIARNSTVMKKVLEGSRPPRPADTSLLSDEIWKVIEMCWNQEPRDRPSAESVIEELPLAGVVDDRPSGDDHLAPSYFRAAGPANSGVVFDPAVDIILSSVLMSTRTNEAKPHAI